MGKQAITEEMGLQKQWYEQARKQTPKTLPAFLKHLANDYQHDYGTYCHMVAASALGAAWAAGQGLSGFQGGAVMWQFVGEWAYSGNKCGLRILDYDNVLYPQYADTFQGQTVSEKTWGAIQAEAKAKLAADAETLAKYGRDMEAYAKDIAAFRTAHPDYDQRPEHYLPISSGTGAQWEAERIKKESGFVFAPVEPYQATAAPRVAAHWRAIVAGRLPFGMVLGND